MESVIPPSYEEATTKDHWALIAEYIASSDLCSASLVSKRWHQIFAPYLWGNPARHFGSENDRVYVALTRFKRTLPTARSNVRQLTHTLHLPPALSEIYDGPKAEWLRDVLEQLPNLQSMVVSRLPFFDHSALLSLRQYSATRVQTRTTDFPTFPLRLLIATSCTNTTSSSLSEALLHWPNLVFLDLSGTIPARDSNVLSSFYFMPGLQVLKLRRIGLRDEDVEILADAIGLSVRSLDIRDNRITDVSIFSLLKKCFHSTKDIQAEQMRLSRARMADEDWPSGVPRLEPRVLDEFRGDDLDERFVRRLTMSVVGRLPSEDLPRSGITHLYIGNNNVTMEGLASLIRTENLHVLDAGAVDTARTLGRPRSLSATTRPNELSLPGAEKLTPVLEACARKNLTSLRLDNAVVTMPAALRDGLTSLVELGGNPITADDLRVELEASGTSRHELGAEQSSRVELDATLPIYELPGGDYAPRYELEGSTMPTDLSPASIQGADKSKQPRNMQEDIVGDSMNRGAVFAPDVFGTELPAEDTVPATDLGSDIGASMNPDHETNSTGNMSSIPPSNDVTQGIKAPRFSVKGEIARIEARRHELRHGVCDPSRGLLPGLVPCLRTLILTGVPDSDDLDERIVNTLKRFISDCALESHLATSQAALEYPSIYVPGKPRYTTQNHRSRELFSLRQIVLEMAYPSLSVPVRTRARSDSPTSPGFPYSPNMAHSPNSPFAGSSYSASIGGSTFNQRNRSSTGDPDTERFWKTQEDDFTFFGEEECGLPAREPGLLVPRSILDQKMSLADEGDNGLGIHAGPGLRISSLSVPQPKEEAEKSVIAELARWRAERRNLAERLGKDGGFVDGFWKGEVKIVRPGNGDEKGFVEWYGNYFEKGVYR